MNTIYTRDYRSQLHTSTFEMLKHRPRTLTLLQIANETGIPIGWLKMFLRDTVQDPGANRLEFLNRYLTTIKDTKRVQSNS